MGNNYFNDKGQKILDFALELRSELYPDRNAPFSPETMTLLGEALHTIERAASLAYEIEQLYSNKIDEYGFQQLVERILGIRTQLSDTHDTEQPNWGNGALSRQGQICRESGTASKCSRKSTAATAHDTEQPKRGNYTVTHKDFLGGTANITHRKITDVSVDGQSITVSCKEEKDPS